MSWDPNQPQGQPPSGPNPYDPQQAQSMPPSQNPYEQPISAPQNPYGAPQPTPPPQNFYAQPVSGVPFGAPGYQQTGYAYAPQAPQPLGQGIQGLFSQYIKILTKPGAQSFAEEMGKASWGMIWIQLLFVGIIGTIVGLIDLALSSAMVSSLGGSSAGAAFALVGGVFTGAGSLYAIVSTIVSFFILVGIQYLLAKAFGGNGLFVQQGYSYLLFNAPIIVVSSVLGLIPVLGGIIGFALAIYGLVLNVFSIMATHRLSGGKATWVVLIPIIAVFLLVFLCALAFIALFLHAASNLPTY